MKKTYYLVILVAMFILGIFGFCFETEDFVTYDGERFTFHNSELVGEWIQTTNQEGVINPNRELIKKIRLNENFTAEIVLLDSSQNNINVSGNWRRGVKPTMVKSDFTGEQPKLNLNPHLFLTFHLNGDTSQVLMLRIGDMNKKNVLISPKGWFRKAGKSG
ncbi:hypothetical protein SAMN04487911_12611 [Arenibacter nanhaiticus]|uniref:Lipocalin-like domain-containing protein n=1 Tax=Arenibacter nanhaiticus TaxID=558155 RepID=A0A1M6KI26_9FLAO|nr:hypothetical protein [Arenibacter nanhaiticus]SHJ58623.1 hypothetical protein SAMN04487911_12611 [Arenibacter nanhaiticus]